MRYKFLEWTLEATAVANVVSWFSSTSFSTAAFDEIAVEQEVEEKHESHQLTSGDTSSWSGHWERLEPKNDKRGPVIVGVGDPIVI